MRSILCVFCFFSLLARAQTYPAKMPSLPYNTRAVYEDFYKILVAANLPPERFDFKFVGEKLNEGRLICDGKRFTLLINSDPGERTSAVYKGLREMGFLFPHPLRQISPTLEELRRRCNRAWTWKPMLKYRGFHLHTLHPNEWVAAFYQNKSEIAEAVVRWLARNGQNIFDLSLLRVDAEELSQQLRPHFELARSLQIHTGVSLGIALQQQNSYKLLSLFESITGWGAKKRITAGIEELNRMFPLSYIVMEAGTSEFTPTNYTKTLNWLNLAGEITRARGLAYFTKVHVSTNQNDKKWGNYNFLPQYAAPSVGVLPHTVMFYGLEDEKAPMYGNKNFHAIAHFLQTQKPKRPTWYYPETSYWVAMDMDVPLFLTNYLKTRAQDMQFISRNGIEGQLTFTSGQTLGYWLFDWTVALLADGEYKFNPLTGLKLLNENLKGWEKILSYQDRWYKEQGLIAYLSSANLQDELSEKHRIHDRHTMKQLSHHPIENEKEIDDLERSLKEFPEIGFIKNEELRKMLLITRLRQRHALMLRLFLRNKSHKEIEEASRIRKEALALVKELATFPTNYPQIPLFDEWKNPTSYQFGYLYPAARLYFWEREEKQIKHNSYFPFWGNIYDVLDVVF